MSLPNPGNSISLSQINTELGRSPSAQVSLNTAEDGGYVAINQCSVYKPLAASPVKFSEWYRYNHSAICGVYVTVNIYAPGSSGSVNITRNGTEVVNTTVSTTGFIAGTISDSIVVNTTAVNVSGSSVQLYISKDGADVFSGSDEASVTTTYSFNISGTHTLVVDIGLFV